MYIETRFMRYGHEAGDGIDMALQPSAVAIGGPSICILCACTCM